MSATASALTVIRNEKEKFAICLGIIVSKAVKRSETQVHVRKSL